MKPPTDTLEHADPVIEAMRRDIQAIKDAVAGPFGKPEEGMAFQHATLKGRVAALESQWGKVYALMTIPVGSLLVIAVNSIFGGKH